MQVNAMTDQNNSTVWVDGDNWKQRSEAAVQGTDQVGPGAGYELPRAHMETSKTAA